MRWLWFSSNLVSSFSCVEFSSKNFVFNCFKFSDGIGFNILVCVTFAGGEGLAISVFCGMCRVIG